MQTTAFIWHTRTHPVILPFGLLHSLASRAEEKRGKYRGNERRGGRGREEKRRGEEREERKEKRSLGTILGWVLSLIFIMLHIKKLEAAAMESLGSPPSLTTHRNSLKYHWFKSDFEQSFSLCMSRPQGPSPDLFRSNIFLILIKQMNPSKTWEMWLALQRP